MSRPWTTSSAKINLLMVLKISPVPHAIRRVGSRYEYLGKAYTEGIMDGKAIVGSPARETFLLV